MDIGLVSYSLAAAAFFGLSALLTISWKRGRLGAWLLVACVVTALWAVVAAYDAMSLEDHGRIGRVLEVLRSAGWLAFLVGLLRLPALYRGLASLRGWLAPAIIVVCVVLILLDLGEWPGSTAGLPVANIDIGGRLALSVCGLLMVENLFRNSAPERRWAIKFLCIGVGGLFAYDFFLYSEALLYQRVNADLFAARGLVNAIVVPLIAVSAARNPDWTIDVFVSRRVIFHTTTLVAAGGYLLFMAAAGYYVRQFGGEWGPILQTAVLFAAALLLILVMISGRARAFVKVKINKHFFTYKYDYREEWLRFIATISSVEGGGGLPVKVVQGVADIVESPEGALWLRDQGESYHLAAAWNVSQWNLGAAERAVDIDASFSQFLEERGWVVNLDQYAVNRAIYDGMTIPPFIEASRRAWLIVPLMHHSRLFAFLVLGQPRAPKELNWEDYDLLKTVGRQAASYLAEQEAAKALAQARQFEEFNRRFAFVLHDIKNLVSQLSLMARNAEKHKDNPAFLEDMVATVKESVEKMNRLLVRLHEGGKEAKATSAIELASFLRRAVEAGSTGGREPQLECKAQGILVVADEDRFSAVMAHLIGNALDATADNGGAVRVRLSGQGGDALIEVEDDGTGMDAEFIRNDLFKPFKTTKSGGYGIGAFESRQFVQELGGRMDVFSEKGKGSKITILLPALSGEAADQPEAVPNDMVEASVAR